MLPKQGQGISPVVVLETFCPKIFNVLHSICFDSHTIKHPKSINFGIIILS